MEGYIPISRTLFEHPFWCEERVFSKFEAWVDILQLARFEKAGDRKILIGNKMVSIHRGQFIASLRYLGSRWGWSKNKVSSFITLLVAENMVKKDTEKDSGQTIITICKYEQYNDVSGMRKDSKKDSSGTGQGQLRDSTGTNNNKVNKENNNTPLYPPTEEKTDSGLKTKQEKEKEKNSGKKERSQPDALQFPFSSVAFMQAWNELMTLPKWKNKMNRMLQISLDRLSKYDEVFAIELIQNAIAGNYQGITFPNTDEVYLKWKKQKGSKLPVGQIYKSENKRVVDW